MSENRTPVTTARQLRRNSTDEEKILWQKLRSRKFHGLKFLRQHALVYDEINGKALFFVSDFYCAEKKTIIEIDGKIHDYQQDYDERREDILKNMGLKIIRFKSREIGNIANVLKRFEEFVLS